MSNYFTMLEIGGLHLSLISLSVSSNWNISLLNFFSCHYTYSSITYPQVSSDSLFFFLQLQRFRRSISLKTILRSKSVENFFQKSNNEAKISSDVLLGPPVPPPPPSPPPVPNELQPQPDQFPYPYHKSLSVLQPVHTHSFQDHVFKKQCPCHLCHQIIVGRCQTTIKYYTEHICTLYGV